MAAASVLRSPRPVATKRARSNVARAVPMSSPRRSARSACDCPGSTRSRDPPRRAHGKKRQNAPFGGGRKGAQRQKTYRSQLDRLFESGGIGKLVADQEKQKKEELAQKVGTRPPQAPTGKPAEAAPPVED